MSTIQESAEFIIKSIVSDPSQITVNGTEENDYLHLEVSAPAEIVGQVIGKEGKIIKSIRTILNLAYPSQKYTLDIKN